MQIDWKIWKPGERATLCFILRGDQILLIRKLRGLGAGKINGPGGRLDPGETPMEAAVRETQEELCVSPRNLVEAGLLWFQFTDGYALECTVFSARDFEGEPTATEEAIPIWTPIHLIPYEEMWADDALWMPDLLAGRKFFGRFVFDKEKMLTHEIDRDFRARS